MKSKKSFANDWIVIILIVVMIIIMLLFINNLRETYKKQVSSSVCKDSIKLQSLTHIKTVSLDSDIKCPLQTVTIDETSPEKIRKELADYYYDMCNEFYQGKELLFGKDGVYCIPRTNIKFKKDVGKISGFGEYLMKNKATGTSLTYVDYCSGFATEDAERLIKDEGIDELSNAVIDTEKEYILMFVYIKGEDKIRESVKFTLGTSSPHIVMYAGTGITIAGIVIATQGAGIPIMMLGAGSSIGITGGATNYFTNPNIKKDYVSFFIIREFTKDSVDDLKQLNCNNIPSKQ